MIRVVLVNEEAAGRKFHAGSLEITGRDDTPVGGDAFPCLFGRGVVGVGSLRAAAGQREAIDAAHRLHAGDISGFLEQLAGESVRIIEFRVARAGNVELHGECMGGFVAGLGLFEQEEAADEKSGAEEEAQMRVKVERAAGGQTIPGFSPAQEDEKF